MKNYLPESIVSHELFVHLADLLQFLHQIIIDPYQLDLMYIFHGIPVHPVPLLQIFNELLQGLRLLPSHGRRVPIRPVQDPLHLSHDLTDLPFYITFPNFPVSLASPSVSLSAFAASFFRAHLSVALLCTVSLHARVLEGNVEALVHIVHAELQGTADEVGAAAKAVASVDPVLHVAFGGEHARSPRHIVLVRVPARHPPRSLENKRCIIK